MTADPKPRGRYVNPRATAAWMRQQDGRGALCACCRQPAQNAHHFVPKDAGGDDVPCNFVPVCGHGTARCHGALHGSPYVDSQVAYALGLTPEARITPEVVRQAVGLYVVRYRPDVLVYVGAKLGASAGLDFLRREYRLLAGSGVMLAR